jgi:hypothetical protein
VAFAIYARKEDSFGQGFVWVEVNGRDVIGWAIVRQPPYSNQSEAANFPAADHTLTFIFPVRSKAFA